MANNRLVAQFSKPSLQLAIVVLVTYSPVLFHDFEYTSDDNWMLLSNSNVWNKDLKYVFKQIFTQFEYGQYSPINTLMYRLIFQIFGMKSVFFYATGILLHSINSIFVYWLFLLIQSSFNANITKGTILFGSMLFAVLPAHVEVVSWIAASKILGSTLFSLAAITAFIRNLDRPNTFRECSIIVSLLLAFGFKEQAIMTPPILIAFGALHPTTGIKTAVSRYGYLLFFSIFGLYWSYLGSLNLIHVFPSRHSVSTVEFLGLPLYCLFFYVYHTFIPINLAVRYYVPSHQMMVLILFLSLFVLIFLIKIKKTIASLNREVIFGLIFFLFSISCFINLIPLPRPSIAADRYLYFASIGLILAVLPIINKLLKRTEGIVLIFAYLFLLIGITFERCLSWSFL